MSDTHAYRASDALAAAIQTRSDEAHHFALTVIKPWDETHPDTRSLWRKQAFGLDKDCVGFDDPESPTPPAGLSRSKQRHELIPARGRSGDPWREALKYLNLKPRIGPVFTAFGIDPVVWHGNGVFTCGCRITPDGVFLTWDVRHPEPGEHLIPVPLSEYYAAMESAEREQAS
jgi:hypothetical protein